jgi:hypothetical protein
MAEPMIETPLSSGTTDVPNAPQSGGQGVNEASAVAAGYPVQHAAPSLPAFDPKTFRPLGQTSTSTSAATPTAQTQGLPPVDMSSFKPLGSSTSTTPPEKKEPGHIDYSSFASTNKGAFDNLAQDTINAGKGAVKGVWDTIAKPPEGDDEKKVHGVAGIGGLAIYRTLRGLGQSASQAAQIAPAIHDINQSKDPLGIYLKAAQRTSSEGAGQALTALGTEGVIKTAPEAVNLGKAAYKNTKGLISHSTLQEPLQTGIRDIVADAVKNAPVEPAPEPNYAYRSRDAGEAGVPKAHAQSHGQATSDLSQAKTYAEPGQRGAVGEGVEKPQEVVRVDLNKLKPEDYTTRTRDGKSWTDFKRPLAEDEVTKVTPELEASEAAEKANVPSEPIPTKSIRKTVEQAGDKVHAASKADYKILDEATNGRFQRFRDKLANGRRQLQNLSGSEEDVQKEASILKGQKETEDAMQEAFDEAKEKGVDPKLIDRADANFRKSQALYDLDNAVKKSTKGSHPDFSTPELLKDAPETLNPKTFHSRINALYDSGRLQDALGEEGANKMFDHTLEHSGAYDKIMRNRKLGMVGAGAALGAAGAGGYVAHKLAGATLGQ